MALAIVEGLWVKSLESEVELVSPYVGGGYESDPRP